MPFFVYQLTPGATGVVIAESPRNVSLAGHAGPLRRYAEPLFPKAKDGVLTWHVEEADILRLLNETADTSKRAVIVDLKPADGKAVSLYRVRHVWGWSEPEWTPLAIQLEALFVEEAVDAVHTFKARFELPQSGELVHEFLYLQGGFEAGRWVWGRNGSVNATLLWPRTFYWFVKQISPYLPGQ